MKTKLILAFLAVAVAACQDEGSVLSAHEAHEGTAAIYAVDTDEAFDTAARVLREEGGVNVEEHRAEGYLLANYGMTAVSWGTFAGVWVESVGPHASRVTVITKRKVAINAVTVLTESGFQEKFAQVLAQSASATPAPR
jgi:hypothetical protein